jgi:hypothetical protein
MRSRGDHAPNFHRRQHLAPLDMISYLGARPINNGCPDPARLTRHAIVQTMLYRHE